MVADRIFAGITHTGGADGADALLLWCGRRLVIRNSDRAPLTEDGARHWLACPPQCQHALLMFVVSEEAAVAIRTAYEQEGELPAAIELRRLFAIPRRQQEAAPRGA
jgi:hypothetical protein